MTRTTATVALGLMWALAASAPAGAQQATADELQARLWFDQGEEPVVERGDRLRLYYRASHDAYVAVIHIDSDGTTNLVFPRSPDENHYVRGGRDYRLLFPRSPYWHVEDSEGIGYFFMVASPEPFDFSDVPYSYYDGGWDLSTVGRRVYSDPYVAMDEYVASLIPDWEVVPYALDFATYHVDRRHEYPRFLCYDCHGFQPYSAWNPYYATCTTFQVVVYDDPYYYPDRRYLGRNVVWVRPPRPGAPRFAFKERPAGAEGVVVVQQRPPLASEDVRPAARRAPDAARPPVTGRPAGEPDGRPPVVRWRDPATGTTGEAGSPAVERRPTARPTLGEGGAAAPRRPADVLRRPLGGAPAGGAGAPAVTPGRPTAGSAPSTPAPSGEPPRRPVLRRRPPGGGDAGGRPGGGGTEASRGGSDRPGSIRIVGPREDRTRPPPSVVDGPRRQEPASRRPSAGAGRPSGAASGGVAVPSGRRPSAAPSGARPSAGSDPRPSARPSGGSSARPQVRPSGASSARPQVRPSGGSSARPQVRPSGASGTRPQVRPSGGSGTRPQLRPSGGSARPQPRPGGGSARPRPRPGGGSSARPPVRPGGGSSARPSPRPGGSGASRPAVRPSGGSARPGARPGGSSPSRPPVRRPPPPGGGTGGDIF